MKISQQGMGTAALLIVAGAVLSRVFGFVRETVIAYQFGATAQTDAYLVAVVIPAVISGLAAGAVTIALVPVFTEHRLKATDSAAWAVAGSVFSATALLLCAAAAVFFLAAPFVAPLIGPGLSPESKALAVRLSRLLAPTIVLIGLIGVATAVLNAYRHFTYPAFAGILYNLGMIAGALLLGRAMGLGGLALGAVAGAAAQFLVLSALVAGKGPLCWPTLRALSHPGVKRVGALALPVVAGSLVAQVGVVVERVLASGLDPGSISALNFALRVKDLPVTILASSVAVATFPFLAEHATAARIDRLRQTLSDGLRMLWFILFPTSVGLLVLRVPVIRLLFERGAFDSTATQMTAVALLYYSLGIVAVGAHPLLARTYFAMQDTMTPVKLSLAEVTLNVILNLILVRHMAHGGLALANSIAAVAGFVLLAYFLRGRLGHLDGRRIVRSAVKFALASLVMGVVVAVAHDYSASIMPNPGLFQKVLQMGGLIALGGAVYVGAAALLRAEELAEVVRRVVSRVLLRDQAPAAVK